MFEVVLTHVRLYCEDPRRERSPDEARLDAPETIEALRSACPVAFLSHRVNNVRSLWKKARALKNDRITWKACLNRLANLASYGADWVTEVLEEFKASSSSPVGDSPSSSSLIKEYKLPAGSNVVAFPQIDCSFDFGASTSSFFVSNDVSLVSSILHVHEVLDGLIRKKQCRSVSHALLHVPDAWPSDFVRSSFDSLRTLLTDSEDYAVMVRIFFVIQ